MRCYDGIATDNCRSNAGVFTLTGSLKKYRSIDERWDEAVKLGDTGDVAGSLYLFKKLAAEGNVPAFAQIASIYQVGGNAVPQNLDLAVEWYKKAIDFADDAAAYLGLALLYRSSAFGEDGYKDAAYYLSEIAQATNPEELEGIYPCALVYLAGQYVHGQGVEKDLTQAREFLEKAKQHGSITAERELAYLDILDGHKIRGYVRWARAILRYLRTAISEDKSSIAGW